MQKKEIITICGSLGSGKSSTANMVAKKLNFQRFSTGDFFREIGLSLGLSINGINKKAEDEPEIDKMVDEKLRQLRNAEKMVIDSRTAFHFIPESFKVYLDLPPEIAKGRIMNSTRGDKLRKQSEQISSPEESYKKIQERFESEQKRYRNVYGINNTDKNNFDLIIDTDKNNLKQVVEIVFREYQKWIKN